MAQKVKPSNPSQEIDTHIGDEEQNGKQKKSKERNRERVPNPATPDHLLASYDPHGSSFRPQGEYLLLLLLGINPSRQHSRYYIAGGSGEEER